MGILLGLLFVFVLLIYLFVYAVYGMIADKLRMLFGYKKYEYTKILSHGVAIRYMWHRTDNEALDHYKHFEFVDEVMPNHRRLKPIN